MTAVELGEVARRHARGSHLAGADHRLQVDGARGRRCRGGRARLPPSARAGRRHRGRAVIPLAEIEAARERLAGSIVRTPLVRLELEDAPAEIYLKLENLQPIGSFKLRGAGNALLLASPEELEHGVWTASAGNMAQGVAWWARTPRRAAARSSFRTRLRRRRSPRSGGSARTCPGHRSTSGTRSSARARSRASTGCTCTLSATTRSWPATARSGSRSSRTCPTSTRSSLPYGGGGLSCGIASALRALAPSCKVFACRGRDGGPLAPSLAAGQPVKVDYTPSFVDGIGSPEVFPEMFELAARARWTARSSPASTRSQTAVRLLAERARVVAEGAGATRGRARTGRSARATARSSASSPAGTSTRRSWPRSSAAKLTPATRARARR